MDAALRDDIDVLLTYFLRWGWGNYDLDPPLQILWELSVAAAERHAKGSEDSVREHALEVLLRAGTEEESAQETAEFICVRFGAITGALRHVKLTPIERRYLPHARTLARHAACDPNGDPRWARNPRRRTWDQGRIITFICASEEELAEHEDGYFHDGQSKYLHREDGPAMESYHDESRCVLQDSVWYQRGRCHREDGPALIFRDSAGEVRHEAWYRDDVRHREDGPAETNLVTPETREYMRGGVPVYGWWLDGRQMTFDTYLRRVTAPVRTQLLLREDHFRTAGSYFNPEAPEQMSSSVFISYGGPDERFASKLTASLRSKGVRTWFFPNDAVAGEKLHRVMHDGVNKHDRVLLICSKASLQRRGVLNELERVFEREAREGGADILLPVRIDDFVLRNWAPTRIDVAQQVRDRVIADFSDWDTDPNVFEREVLRLLKALFLSDEE